MDAQNPEIPTVAKHEIMQQLAIGNLITLIYACIIYDQKVPICRHQMMKMRCWHYASLYPIIYAFPNTNLPSTSALKTKNGRTQKSQVNSLPQKQALNTMASAPKTNHASTPKLFQKQPRPHQNY
jgi:hypothetical protein